MKPALKTSVGRYALDKSASRFTVRAFAGGLLSSLGHNPVIAIRDFKGEAVFDPAAPQKASLRIEIGADSLEVIDDIGAKDRAEMESAMKRQVLETATYPWILFEGAATSADRLDSAGFQVRLSGDLSLRGITRKVPVTARIVLLGDTMRASGEFSLLQSDYGIERVSVAGGALKLKDELKFAFDMVARKRE